jgi:hypothetical protein
LTTGGYQDQELRRPNWLATLAIASIASVVAAIFTSKVVGGGVVGTAALTPVIVALVTEVLRPISEWTNRGAIEPEPPEPRQPPPKRPFPWGGLIAAILIAILIGLLAFVVAAVALTVPEVLADQSITGESGHTTYFGDNADKPWGADRNWSDCFDDLEQCIRDIIEDEPVMEGGD